MKNFDRHTAAWRDPGQVAGQWQTALNTDPDLLRHSVRGKWWETLAGLGITLIVTRETEHLVIAMRSTRLGPDVSFFRLPHPSGLVVDRHRAAAYVASTRNPNQIFEFRPAVMQAGRPEVASSRRQPPTLLPVRSRILPGSLYVHDLALIGGELHAAAVGQNAVISLPDRLDYRRVWWPTSIETASGPVFHRNHLQLNSIAAGATVDDSYIAASTDRMSSRRPGHLNFPVDRRGVIFSGRTREPVVRGLTRPHSTRFHDGHLWVDDSGYGTCGPCEDGRLTVAASLPGWTRGLSFADHVAFIGTSRVIPRYRRYAPGLHVDSSRCGVHALDTRTGEILGSLEWPAGNQIFGIDWIDSTAASGLPFRRAKRRQKHERDLFYSFATAESDGGIDASL